MQNEDITNTVRQAISEDSQRTGQTVFRGLLDSLEVNKLPENIFVTYFLPLFLGRVDKPKDNWVMEWVSIAGTPMAEVAIVSDATGEELFRVPPLLHTSGLVMDKKEGDLGDIFGRYNQISQNVPSSGLMFLIEALNNKNKQYLDTFDNTGVVARWFAILARYGYVDPNTVNVTNSNSTAPLEDYFDFQ